MGQYMGVIEFVVTSVDRVWFFFPCPPPLSILTYFFFFKAFRKNLVAKAHGEDAPDVRTIAPERMKRDERRGAKCKEKAAPKKRAVSTYPGSGSLLQSLCIPACFTSVIVFRRNTSTFSFKILSSPAAPKHDFAKFLRSSE